MSTRRIIQIVVVLLLVGGIGNFILTGMRTRADLAKISNTTDPQGQQQGTQDLIDRGALFDALQGGSPPATRMAAIDVLGRMAAGGKDQPAFRQLLLMLKDPDNETAADKTHPVRDAATAMVARVGPGYPDILLDAAKDPDGTIHDQVRVALKAIGAPMETQIAARLGDKDLRMPLGDILVNIGPQTVPLITPYLAAPLLKADDSAAKTDLISTLGKFKTPDAASAVLPFAQDADPNVRRTVIASLANIDTPNAGPALIGALRDKDFDSSARAAAAGALGTIATPEAVAALGTALTDDDLAVADAAAAGLHRAGDAAMAVIEQALASPQEQVRVRAALASGGLSQPTLAERALTADPDPAVRAAAARSVGDILVARNAVTAPACAPLLAALADKNGTVAVTAEQQLGRLGAAAVPALAPDLASKDDTVAYYATEAMRAIGTPAVPPLVAMAEIGKPTARWAAVALGQIGDPRAAAALEALKASPDSDTAYVAAAALSKVQTGG